MTNEGPSQFTENEKMYNYENYEKKPEMEDLKNKSPKFENRVHVKKKSLVYLWSFLLFYLTSGAVIINQIEQNREVSKTSGRPPINRRFPNRWNRLIMRFSLPSWKAVSDFLGLYSGGNTQLLEINYSTVLKM